MLRATKACTFSTSQLVKVARSWCVLYILTWKCASRHKGMHFFDISTSKSGAKLVCFVHFDLEMCFAQQPRAIFISHLASWLRTRRFSEPTFRPSGATNHWKNTVNRDFPSFSRICIFFLLFHFHPSSNLSLLSASSLLCFSSVHIVGSLTSKLPSIICHNNLYNIKNSIYFWLELSGESPQCSTMEPDSWFPIRFVIFVGGGCFHAIRFGGSLAIREPREGLA